MRSKENFTLPILLICLVTILLYGAAITFEYVWDDNIWLNYLKRNGGDVFVTAFLKPFLIGKIYWRPLAELTLYIQPSRGAAVFQHGINVVIHLVNIALLFKVALLAIAQTRLSRSFWIYLLIGAYAVHPAFVEPVAWVSGRFDLLLGTTILFSALILLGSFSPTKKIVLLSICYATSLMTKETAIFFIPLYLGFSWLLDEDNNIFEVLKRNKKLIASLMAVSIVWLGLRVLVLGSTGSGFFIDNTGPIFTFYHWEKVSATVGAYVALLTVPFMSLSSLYPVDTMLDKPWYSILGVVYLCGMLYLLSRKGNRLKLGIIMALFLIPLVLVLNIIQVGFPNNLIQNRYLYPSFTVLIISLLVSNLSISLSAIGEKTFIALAVGWIIFAAINITVTLPLWKSTDVFSSWLVMENPDNPYAANMRASYLLNNGYVEDAMDMAGTVAVNQPTSGAYKILGDGAFMLGKCQEALTYYYYAHDMGAFPVEEAEGLLGMYKINYHTNYEKASELKGQIFEVLENDKDNIGYALERLDQIENTEIVCRD